MTTLISICIPTFNNAAMVGDAIASAQRQTHSDLEILVLDNDSQDDTARVVARCATGDSRVRYVRHPTNLGMAGNFNSALTMARGPLVMILCADDILEANAIRLLAAPLLGHDNVVLAAGSRIIVDSLDREMSRVRLRPATTVVTGPSMIDTCFAEGNRLGEPSAVLFRRSAAFRGFDPSYHQFIDVEMWVHLLRHGDAALIPEAVARIRRHAGQWSEANIGNGRLIRDKQSFFRLLAPELRPRLGALQRLRWDARMASSVARTRQAGKSINTRDIDATFFPMLFPVAIVIATATLRLARFVAQRRK